MLWEVVLYTISSFRNVYPRTHIFQHFIFIFVCSALNVVTFPILYAAWLCNDKSDMVCRRIKAYKVIHKLISDFIWAVDAFTIFPTWMLKNIQLLLVLFKNSFRIFVTSCLFRNNIIKIYRIGMTELYLRLWVLVCNFDRRHYFNIIEVSISTYSYEQMYTRPFNVLLGNLLRENRFIRMRDLWMKVGVYLVVFQCCDIEFLHFYVTVIVYWFSDRN